MTPTDFRTTRVIAASATPSFVAEASRPPQPILTACGLALGPAVATGLGRFAYALILPAMRDDLAWSYTQAGWINTANALGYLIGALISLKFAALVHPRKCFNVGIVFTAMMLMASGTTRQFEALLFLRLLTGISSALVFISGGLLAANVFPQGSRLAPTAIAIYFGGAGLGILLSGAALPWLFEIRGSHSWSLAWIGMEAASLVCAVPSVLASAMVPLPRATGQASHWKSRLLLASLLGKFLHAIGYIAYMTFVIAWMKTRGSSALEISLVWAILGLAVIASPLPWRRPLNNWPGGLPLAVAILVLAIGAALPLFGSSFAVMSVSAALVGSAVLIPPAAVTAFARRSLPPAALGSAIAGYTVVFAVGQCMGPVLTGFIADATGTLFAGLATSVLVLLAGALAAACQKDVIRPMHTIGLPNGDDVVLNREVKVEGLPSGFDVFHGRRNDDGKAWPRRFPS
jgi:predicted MFS family arabinose efflux permease